MTDLGLTYGTHQTIPTLENFVSLVKEKNLSRSERFFASFGYVTTQQKVMKDLQLLCEDINLPGKTIKNKTLRINGLDERRAQTAEYGGDNLTLNFLVDTDWTPRKYFEEWMGSCVGPVTEGKEVGFYSSYAKNISLFALMPAGLPGEKLLNLSPTVGDNLNLGAGLTQDARAGAAINKFLNRGSQKIVDKAVTATKAATVGRLDLASNPIFEAFRETENIMYEIHLIECWPTSINVMNMNWANPGFLRMSVNFTFKYWVSHAWNNDDYLDRVADSTQTSINDAMANFGQKISRKLPNLDNLGSDLQNKFRNFTR